MMPNVVRGDRMSGLMVYLLGPGRQNEHTEPHLVAGDDALMVWHDDAELGRDAALSIARHLDRPRRAFGVEVKGGHVWHASLSLRADEGVKTDEQWKRIAEDFVAAMGFDDAEGTKAPCRWVAVRHGLSGNGNDHIHIAVNLVREDGTKASTHRDYHRAQAAARALEVEHGLERLESVKAERSTRGWELAERESVARRRAESRHQREDQSTPWTNLPAVERQALVAAELRADQPRHELARAVRGCATASNDEAEFVRRMRGAGVLLRPRFADGRSDVVTGYSVAARPEAGERPIWYGGGQLGRDLALPRLRAEWPDSPQGASDAAAEWNAAKRARRVVAPGREVESPDPQLWVRFTDEMEQLNRQLREVPMDDHQTWARVARRTSGALAAWSGAVEKTPGALAGASDALARSAQTFRRETSPSKAGLIAVSGAAMLVASAAHGGQGPVAQAALLRALMNLAKSVHDAAAATQQQRQAQAIANEMRGRLGHVHQQLTDAGQQQTATAVATLTPPIQATAEPLDPATQAMLERVRVSQARRATEAITPMPAQLRPQAQPQTIRPGAARGPERDGRD